MKEIEEPTKPETPAKPETTLTPAPDRRNRWTLRSRIRKQVVVNPPDLALTPEERRLLDVKP